MVSSGFGRRRKAYLEAANHNLHPRNAAKCWQANQRFSPDIPARSRQDGGRRIPTVADNSEVSDAITRSTFRSFGATNAAERGGEVSLVTSAATSHAPASIALLLRVCHDFATNVFAWSFLEMGCVRVIIARFRDQLYGPADARQCVGAHQPRIRA